MSERRLGENYDRKTVRHLAKQMLGTVVMAWCSKAEEPAPWPQRLKDESVKALNKRQEEHSLGSNGFVGSYSSLVVFQPGHADCAECIAKYNAATEEWRTQQVASVELHARRDEHKEMLVKLEELREQRDAARQACSWAENSVNKLSEQLRVLEKAEKIKAQDKATADEVVRSQHFELVQVKQRVAELEADNERLVAEHQTWRDHFDGKHGADLSNPLCHHCLSVHALDERDAALAPDDSALREFGLKLAISCIEDRAPFLSQDTIRRVATEKLDAVLRGSR